MKVEHRRLDDRGLGSFIFDLVENDAQLSHVLGIHRGMRLMKLMPLSPSSSSESLIAAVI